MSPSEVVGRTATQLHNCRETSERLATQLDDLNAVIKAAAMEVTIAEIQYECAILAQQKIVKLMD